MDEFHRFFENNPNCSGFKNNLTFSELFKWLLEPKQIFDMVQSCKHDRPALEGVLGELETKFSNRTDFDLTDNFTKQMIGRATKEILADFGYVQTGKKAMPKGKYLKNAQHYEEYKNATKTKELVFEPKIKNL